MFHGANLENAYFNNCWFQNLFFDESTFFGINDIRDDTRTTFEECIIEINNSEPIYEIDSVSIYPYEYFLIKVSIEDSFIEPFIVM